MSQDEKRPKAKKVNRKALDKRNYFIFALVGVILIGILMIVQTRFKEYFRLNNDGFAVVTDTVTKYLSIDPSQEDVETLVAMNPFEALEYLYTQGGKYFLGQDEKVQIDTSYPVYMNQGNLLQLLDGTAILFDEDYEKESTYQGLYLQDGYAYNQDGEMADAAHYLFLGMNNGNFVNFETITYTLKNEELDINQNSLVHFDDDFFSYYEYEKGELVYKYCISVNDSFKLKVDETEYTYDALMKLLGLRSEYPDFSGISGDNTGEEAVPEVEEIPVDSDTEPSAKVEIKRPPVDPPSAPSAPVQGGSKENTNTSPGTRPDNIVRPGTGDGGVQQQPEQVEGYEQPEVTVNAVTASVYRIFLDVTISDPADRIDTTKYVRFEVYEIDADGVEQLAMRGYRRGEGRDTTVLGGGSIKPETKYRVAANYTYYDEYNEEQFVDLGSFEVTTGKFEDLTDITLTHEQGASYNNRIEIINFGYDAQVSDDELVYGVNPYGGIDFIVKDGSGKEVTKRTLSVGEVSNFKYNRGVILSSLSTLKAKTVYQYEFRAKDYFGNEITLINYKGEAMTSNSAPIASIVEKESDELGKVILNLNINDVDAAAVPSLDENDPADACDVYLVLSKDDPSRFTEYDTFEKMKAADEAEDLKAGTESGIIVNYVKLNSSQYTYAPETGIVVTNEEISFRGLRLGEKYFATVYADYDLSNKMGPQYFENIGQMSFKTTDLNSLGKIYVTVDFDLKNLTYKSLPMSFHLNKEATSDELETLITGMDIDVIRGNGVGDDAIIDASFGFDETSITENGDFVLDMFKDTAVTYFADDLQSMTDYQLKAIIYARYQGEIYEITPQLSEYAFKTMRKPAEVIVQDLLFAAGTLLFDVKVEDPDETIVGVSGDKVVVQLYTQAGEFVKTVRVQKGLDEWQTVTFNNLDPTTKYEIRFVAVEYNEGYSNATYVSNKIIKTVSVDHSMSLDGTIKLQSIDAISGDSEHYSAVIKATLNDPDHYLTGEDAIPYYITVYKDGVFVEDIAYDLSGENESTVYEKIHTWTVDKGEHVYDMTMYVIVSGRRVDLDSLSFTTETTVKGFSTAYEMIQLIKSDSDAKFVATNSFVYNSNNWNFEGIVDPGDLSDLTTAQINAMGKKVSGANIVSIFNGTIDFQGFTLEHNIHADNQRMFTNIGSKGVFENVVYSVKNLNTTRIYDDAALCYRNFGTIHDVYVKYRGGYFLNNDAYGLLARVNAATGVIENFVIENIPDEGFTGFTAYRAAGLVTYENYGIIRYGYVYGDNIQTTIINQNVNRYIGGIVGFNQNLGSVYSVYSTLNVDEVSRRLTTHTDGVIYSYGNYYGAVCGFSNGKISNMYSTKDGFYVESKHNSSIGYQHSPIIGGRNNATNSNIYYYSEQTYSQANRPKAVSVGLNELYDVTWQNSILTDAFDTSLVEVGYYPHVKLSADLPEQKYIPLPTRVMEQQVDISRATVLNYGKLADGVTDCATVEFVFSNRDGLDIVAINISDIDVELDLTTSKYEDGYTTIIGVVSNPRTFYSEYEITGVQYYKNGRLDTNNVSFTLKADFFRKIYTTDDWYKYMVNRKNSDEFENVMLEADLDFSGIKASDIMVKHAFGRILDGNGHTMSNIDLQYGFNSNSNGTLRRLFTKDITHSGVARNLYVEHYKAGGEYFNATRGKTYMSKNAALFGTVYGLIENVHLTDVDIVSYEYAAGLVVSLGASGEVRDCSVSGLKIKYNDPSDINSDSYIGGLVARAAEGRISHCYVQDIDIVVDETKSTYGIGGIVGYATNSVIDTVYAEGDIESRAQKVGGIVGQYHCTVASIACMKNMYAKVDIICYTDIAGALVGQTNITQDRISETNNFTGIGLGNVYLSNLDSKNCSQTIGTNVGKNVTFYGTKEQLINGIAGVGYTGKEDSVRGLLSYDELMYDANESYFNVVGFENVYSIADAEEGYLPKMYYTDRSKGLLPNQTDLVLDELKDVDIEVTNVIHNDVNRLVTVELRNPNNYKITSINIRSLKYHFVDMAAGPANYGNAVSIDKASDYDRGITRIYLQYEQEINQEYFLDSYVMDNITFHTVEQSGVDNSLLAENISTDLRNIPIYSRINVMLCMDIPNVGAWNNIPNRENSGHTYENYRLTGNLDFGNVDPATNLKIGRLISDDGQREITNVNISGYDMHLISRLNSGIKGIHFRDSSVSSSGVGCIGLIGVSNGTLLDSSFENISVTTQSNNTHEVGMLGHSNSGLFENIALKNITVNAKNNGIQFVGGLVGKVHDGSYFNNITGENLNVTGTSHYVGGIVGASEISGAENVVLKDIIVKGNASYTGGFAGQFGYSGNSNSRTILDVEITGTPVYDSEGRTTDSTTKISGNNYVGGIAGHTHAKVGTTYSVTTKENNILVDGIVVRGLQRMGGAFGGSYTNMYYVKVQNSLITTRDDIFNGKTTYYYAGGVVGETNYSTFRDVCTDNVVIDVTNVTGIGGLAGMLRFASMQYSYVNNGLIKADTANVYTGEAKHVGGLTGRYENTMYYSGVINTTIDAPKHYNVGGITGMLSESLACNHYIGSCFYVTNYDDTAEKEFNLNAANRYTATADSDKYYIKGFTNVGGIVGLQNSGYVFQTYSNANVIAADSQIAGGISGMYCNHYTTSVSNGKVNYSYGTCGIYRNYFAGNVTAKNGYAGGAIGRTGMLHHQRGTNENGEIATDGYNGNRIKGLNSNSNEVDKTYGNVIIADTIAGGKGKTGAFAADDTQFVFRGRDNRIWDHTIVNDGNGSTYVADLIKGNGDYAYEYWNVDNEIPTGYPQKDNNTYLFESTDMDGSTHRAEYNRASGFYRALGWSLSWLNDASQDYVSRDTSWRVSVGDIPVEGSVGQTRGMKNKYETAGYDTGTYLPQPRGNSQTRMYKDDLNIQMQETVPRLPLPRDKNVVRLNTIAAGFDWFGIDTYGILYASDVDTVNVEFSEDLIGVGYYTLKSGNTIIAQEAITDRCMTFSYGFNENLTLDYGFFINTELDDDKLLNPSNFEEYESLTFGVDDLKTDIMVYHSDYYYIAKEGLVSTAGTWAGDFVHVMNGKALDNSGNVWDIESRQKENTVAATKKQELSKPLWSFDYGSIEIDTYAKYSSIQSEYDTITKNSQIFVVNGKLYTVDGSLETRKTDILIYKLNGEEYQTVLGDDGFMVDMMQDDCNLPKDVKNKAIVRMSNTLDASVPYVLIEYNNGGIVGYNYATGEILFDNSIETNVSILEYAKNFFSGNKESRYANISNTYSANADLSDRITSPADLDKIVGNSSGELVKDNNTGENIGDAGNEKELSNAANSQAGTGIQGVSDAFTGQGSNEDNFEGYYDDTEGTYVSTQEDIQEGSYDADNTSASDASVSDNTDSKADISGEDANKEDVTEDDESLVKGETPLPGEEDSENDADAGMDKEESDGEKTEEEDTSDKENSAEAENGDIQTKPGKTLEEVQQEIGTGEYMTVYNNETGVYEIVSVAEYLTEDAYVSENHRLGVKDLSVKANASGYAVSTVDVNKERGIVIYIIPILMILAITGGIIIYVKRREKHKA